MSRVLAIVAIAAVGIIGIYGALGIGFTNGFLPSITAGLETGEIPGCPAPFKMAFTNFAPLDGFLQNVVPFFCIAIDGKQTWDTTLSNWYLAAQTGVGWIILSLEGLRQGNKGRAVGWTTLVGVLFQAVSYTFTAPVYLIVHLLTSPVSKASMRSAADAVVANASEINLVPICFILTYVVPTVLIALPTPRVMSTDSHYNWIALWQGFPIWNGICFFVLKIVFSSSSKPQLAPAARQSYLRSVATVYTLALGFVVVTHLAVLAIALTPEASMPVDWAPLFGQVGVSTLLPGSLISPPTAEASGGKMPDILAPLAAFLLQYDVGGGNFAILIWALYLNLTASKGSIAGTTLRVLFWTLIGGPIAPAVVLLWERDETVLSGHIKSA